MFVYFDCVYVFVLVCRCCLFYNCFCCVFCFCQCVCIRGTVSCFGLAVLRLYVPACVVLIVCMCSWHCCCCLFCVFCLCLCVCDRVWSVVVVDLIHCMLACAVFVSLSVFLPCVVFAGSFPFLCALFILL